MFFCEIVDFFDVVEIDPAFAEFFAKLVGLPPPEIKCLITTRIETLAAEKRQEFRIKTIEKGVNFWICRRKRPASMGKILGCIGRDIFSDPPILGERMVSRMFEHGGKVAKGSQRGNQLEVSRAAMGVEG